MAEQHNNFVVVYQPGKVASTSIVNSLNNIDGIRAVQSHFLGKESLKSIVDSLVDTNQSEYFHRHRVGQFLNNLDITREILCFREGHYPEKKLTIVSLVRDPFDWFRSSLSQDIEGYIPIFRRYANSMRIIFDSDESLIMNSLPSILSHLYEAFDEIGGVDEFFSQKRPFNEMFLNFDKCLREDLINISCVFIRPFSWLDDHLSNFLLVNIDSFFEIFPLILWKDLKWCGVYIIRYEDLPKSMQFIAKRMNIGALSLNKYNISSEKILNYEINECFKTEKAVYLKKLCTETKYYNKFYRPSSPISNTSLREG